MDRVITKEHGSKSGSSVDQFCLHAATPPDERKGSAFPSRPEKDGGSASLRVEAEPRGFWVSDGEPQAHRPSGGIAASTLT